MSHFDNHPRPWIPGYAIPEYALEEPLPRRARSTPGRPRGAADALAPERGWGNPSPWHSGYELPEYTYDDPEGLAQVTAKRPRGAGPSHASPLAGDDIAAEAHAASDPFLRFGDGAASYLLRTLHEVDPEWREAALKSFMDQLDPSLWGRSRRFAREFREGGVPPQEARRRGIAKALANGVAAEIFEVGRSGRVAASGILALRAYPEAEEQIALGVWSNIKDMAKATYKTPVHAAKSIGSATKRAAKRSWSWSKKAAKKIKSGTCWLVDRKHAELVASLAGGAGGQMIGVPAPAGAAAGGLGVKALQKVCPSDVEDLPPELLEKLMEGAQPQIPWVPIAAAGVGALALVLVLTR